MTGSEILCIQRQRILLEKLKANVAVAFQAGIGRHSLAVLVNEKFHNGIAENLFGIQHVEWNPKTGSDATGIGHLVRCTAAIMRATGNGFFRPETHHHADDIIALLDQ
jgi:hypothetical protein